MIFVFLKYIQIKRAFDASQMVVVALAFVSDFLIPYV